jgi:hypothetical protein
MFRFATIYKETGVEPEEGYMAVGLKGSNLLAVMGVDESKTLDLRFDSSKFDMQAVTREGLARISGVLSEQFLRWGLVADDSAKNYWGVVPAFVTGARRARLFLVTGKVPGTFPITAVNGAAQVKLTVVVLSRARYSVAFRFVQHLDTSNRMTDLTPWNPSDARWLTNKLNWIYGPQANITFSLADADWAKVNKHFDGPVAEDAFKKLILGSRGQAADLAIFFVDKWKGGEAAGTYYADTKSAVVESNPADLPVMPGYDPIVVNLAHEVAHFLLYEELGYLPNHPHNTKNLLSDALQSSRLGKSTLSQITGVSF